ASWAFANKEHVMTGRWEAFGIILATVAGGLWGCARVETEERPDSARVHQAIINGNDASDPKFDAIGALLTVGDWDLACSGTLVAPNAVVTAKHCVNEYVAPALANGETIHFAFGAFLDQLATITGYVSAPPSRTKSGLMLNGGRDLAVLYIDAAPEGIVPAKLGLFTDEALGDQFQIGGYGQDETGFYGWRMSGPATARAIAGQWYNLLFNGDKRAFLDWYFSDAPTSYPKSVADAQHWWKTYRLEPQYELLAGGLPGEALGCFGDSGGPIFLGDSADTLTVYGVSFAVESSIVDNCTRGGAYLVFNAPMLRFVRSAISRH
ncbi:MAG TPA: trypsin-like serine protease, partial [Polyangiaceae bacterium]